MMTSGRISILRFMNLKTISFSDGTTAPLSEEWDEMIREIENLQVEIHELEEDIKDLRGYNRDLANELSMKSSSEW